VEPYPDRSGSPTLLGTQPVANTTERLQHRYTDCLPCRVPQGVP
jgi:hypothetical protein